VTRNDAFPEIQNWHEATILHRQICMGIHRSGPIFFETSCEGSSANRKDIRNTVLP
jgi:hypothetical protein